MSARPHAGDEEAPSPTTTILRGGIVFDAATRTSRRADVRITGDRIVAVGAVQSEPRRNVVLDVTGMTILPGLLNLHTHLVDHRYWGPKAKHAQLHDIYLVIRGVRAAVALLQSGITTVRELGARNHLNLYLRRAIEAEMFPGPRILAAGAPISVTGGHANYKSTEVDGPIGMRRAVRETIKAGADWIKLISSNDPVPRCPGGQYSHPELMKDEYAAAVETAHMWGRRVAAHAMGHESLAWALDAGVDSIEHGVYLDRALAERMAEQNVALVPTLSGYYQTALPRWGRGQAQNLLYEKLLEPLRASTALAIDAGIRIGVGTDIAGDYVEELEMLIECGMSHGQALRAATLDGAHILGWEDRLGSVDEGKIADLLIVRGDPLTDIAAVRAVEWVFQAGRGRRPRDLVLPTEDETAEWTSLTLVP